MITQDKLNKELLANEIKRIASDPDSARQMAGNMKEMGMADASDRIVDVCLSLVNHT